MPGYKPCAVSGCEDKYSPRHRFPNPQKFRNLFQVWVKACCNVKLQEYDPARVYNSYRVCHSHFSKEDISTNNCLKQGIAFPTINLPPSTIGVPEILSESDAQEPKPSTSDASTSKAYSTTDVSAGDMTFVASVPELSFLESQERITSTLAANTSKTFYSVGHENTGSLSVIKSCPDFLLRDVGVTRKEELTPQARKLYTRAARLQKSYKQLKKRQLLRSKKLKGEGLLEKEIDELPSVVKSLVKSQIRLINKDVKGRRYSVDDKILGLILHKQSGKSYRTLSKLFALPSKKTLSTLLGRIPIKCGINESIFNNLKLSVQQLKEKDRICVIMFDEISIEPHIDTNNLTKDFNGFVHTGLHQTDVIADHALVFMVRGLASPWRQPIMFTFCKGATKGSAIVSHLKNIVKECQKAGLRVVIKGNLRSLLLTI